MLKTTILLLAITYSIVGSALSPWGFYAHKRINRLAVFTLPEELFGFYKPHLEFITDHAVDPDKRRYAVENEAPRHYIDIDHYGEYPFEVVPRQWEDAVEKFTEDTLKAYGILPWHLEVMMNRLTSAFRSKDQNRILKYSTEIGHYIADGHVPLHTTKNYNGQLSGQDGIHGLWESRLPEIFSDEYDFFVGKASHVEDLNSYIWDFVLESAIAVDTVLSFEIYLTENLSSDIKYSYEERNNVIVRVYSEDFCTAYHEKMNNMVERRMRQAILSIGDLWYTAWVNAGEPDLRDLSNPFLGDDEDSQNLENKFREGKIKGREHTK